MARLNPSRAESLCSQAALHHQSGLGIFRTTIPNVTPENCDACFAFSATLAVYHWTSTGGKGSLFFGDGVNGEITVEWVKVLRGVHVLKCAWHWILDGPLKPLLRLTPESLQPDELCPEDRERFAELRRLWSGGNAGFTAEDVSSLDEALDLLQESYRFILTAQEDTLARGFDTSGAFLSVAE
ncbi:hypothetical protein B7463_g7409, partial [Scytalidium lignicola]